MKSKIINKIVKYVRKHLRYMRMLIQAQLVGPSFKRRREKMVHKKL